MNKFLKLIPAFVLAFILSANPVLSQLHGTLKPGSHKVGFKIINDKDQQGKPLKISIWYPASQIGSAMKLSDYVDIPSLGGSQDKNVLRSDLKKVLELPFVFGITTIPQKDYDNALTTPMFATLDAAVTNGKWPLIISDAEPSLLAVTNEYLASHGFVVAVPAMQYPAPSGDNTLYQGPTDGLEQTMNFMLKQSYIDPKRVSALGFGGGALAAFYLGMKSKDIKSLVNIEGGLFMPESKTTLSTDYAPGKFLVPLLHVVNPYITSKENAAEFNAVKSPKYRLMEKVRLRHHDFTIYGRIVNGSLKLRGADGEKATQAYTDLHEHILYFFENLNLNSEKIKGSSFFDLETF